MMIVSSVMALAVALAATARAAPVPIEFAIAMVPKTEPSWDTQVPAPDLDLDPGAGVNVILIPVEAPPVPVQEDDVGSSGSGLLRVLNGALQDGSDLFQPTVGEVHEPAGEENAFLQAIGRALSPINNINQSWGSFRRFLGRSLMSFEEDDDPQRQDARESRVLEEEDEPGSRRRRRALRVILKRGAERAQQGDAELDDDQRAESPAPAPAPAPPGGFLETIQGQLPGQLQGLGGAMENSSMVVGSFQALIMPGSAATDFGQQIQGLVSNMPSLPGAGAGGG